MKKRLLMILLVATLLLTNVPIVNAASSKKIELYSIYSDNMLFQQKETAVIKGYGTKGNKITLELQKGKEIIATEETVVGKDGLFSVSFTAPEGSYQKYKIVLKSNSKQEIVLKNIVFGEMWLSAGQSNMMYPLSQEKDGRKLYDKKEVSSDGIRVLIIPGYIEYKGNDNMGDEKTVPKNPQEDISGAKWVSKEDEDIYAMSAVSYYFAESLEKSINMPVGILNVSLGGSSIISWLSREDIDNNEVIKNDLINDERYIPYKDWKEEPGEIEVHHDMTANYNTRIHPIRDFKIAGMIWYQGETDVMFGTKTYKERFDLLQKSYTRLFNYKQGQLPIVYSQIASYTYDDLGYLASDMNILFDKLQKEKTESRSIVSIYDVPLTYINEVGAIHPETKKPIGERMAYCAEGLVYKLRETASAPTIKSSKIDDGAIYVTFDNIGDGIICEQSIINGFAICGENGVYIKADAEIVSKDTVKVFSDEIKNPKSATYAYGNNNSFANLYASDEDGKTLPVSTFITDTSYNTQFWLDKRWAYCNDEKVFHMHGEKNSGYYDTWQADDAEISINENSTYKGDFGLHITSSNNGFSVSPLLMIEETNEKGRTKTVNYFDVDTNYSNYTTISVKVRNNGDKDISLEELRLYVNKFIWLSPELADSDSCSYVIKNDGEWHTLIFNLNELRIFGKDLGFTLKSKRLEEVFNLSFEFSSNGDADLSFDDVTFGVSEIESEDNTTIIDKIKAFFN